MVKKLVSFLNAESHFISWINAIETSKFRTTGICQLFCFGVVCIDFVVLICLLVFLKKLKLLCLLVEENALFCSEDSEIIQAYRGS